MECLVALLIGLNGILWLAVWRGHTGTRRRLDELAQQVEQIDAALRPLLSLRRTAGEEIAPALDTTPMSALADEIGPTLPMSEKAETSPPVVVAVSSSEAVVPVLSSVEPGSLVSTDALARDVPVGLPPVVSPASGSVPPPRTPTTASPEPNVLEPVIAWFRGTSLLVQVGVVLLFFGIAFLLRYAAEQGWLSIELRLAGATVLGVGLIGLGWRLSRSRRIFGLGLQGGGIGILYLTTFAAHRLYGLVPPSLAFAIFVGLGVASVGLALLTNAQILAYLAVLGAFAAPLLAASEGGSHVALFGYYALVNLGIFAIAWFKAWRNLNLVGFFFTLGVGASWGLTSYRSADFSTVEPFLIFFFVLYSIIGILFALRQSSRLQNYVDSVLVFGTPLAFMSLQIPLVDHLERGVAWSTLGVGLWYLGQALIIWRLVRRTHPILIESVAFLAVGFITASVPLFFDYNITAVIWAVQGSALVWIGWRQARLWNRLVGVLILVGAALSLSGYGAVEVLFGGGESHTFFGSGLLLSIAFFVAGYAFHRAAEVRYQMEIVLLIGLVLGAFFWWYASFTIELLDRVDQLHWEAAYLAFLAATALVGEFVAARLRWRMLSWPSHLLPLTVLPFAAYALTSLHLPSHDWGWAGWLSVFVVHYWTLSRFTPGRFENVRHLLGFWLVLVLLTLETGLRLHEWLPGDGWSWGAVLLLPTLTLWAVNRYATYFPASISTRADLYRVTASVPLIVLLLLGAVVLGLGQPAPATPLTYLPLLNPLDVALFVLFVVVLSWFNQRLNRSGRERTFNLGVYALVGLCAFLAANGAVARAVHHLFGVDYAFLVLFNTPMLQTLYSILWSVAALALMMTAKRRMLRPLWFGGAALLALTVLKLFLVDLSRVETIERIVSFLAVGVLVLIIGYFVPLPPGDETEEKA